MLDGLEEIGSDEKLSRGGVCLTLHSVYPKRVGEDDPRCLWVRQAGGHNRQWNLSFARAMALEADVLDDESDATPDEKEAARYRAMRLATIESLVNSWEGFTEGGEPAECTPENLAEVFDRAPELLDAVIGLAASEEEYRLKADTKSGADGNRVGGDEP